MPRTHDAPPLGRLYDVGGRRLAAHVSGAGSPAVVFVPGAAAVGLDYLNVHDRAAKLTTSVIYDRAGTGWSEPAPLPRSAAEITDELRDLLRAAGVPAPYLLVGHSLGGLYARHFVQRYPGEVAGLLLLDPFHEDLDAHMPAPLRVTSAPAEVTLPDLTEEHLQVLRAHARQTFAEWPEEIRELLIDAHLSSAWLQVGGQERQNLAALADEIRQAGDLPDVPMIVLAATQPDLGMPLTEQLVREMNDGKRVVLTALAGSVPRGELRVVDDATHSWLQAQRPDAVIQAVQDLLATR